jgi:hypothetical protein
MADASKLLPHGGVSEFEQVCVRQSRCAHCAVCRRRATPVCVCVCVLCVCASTHTYSCARAHTHTQHTLYICIYMYTCTHTHTHTHTHTYTHTHTHIACWRVAGRGVRDWCCGILKRDVLMRVKRPTHACKEKCSRKLRCAVAGGSTTTS